MAWEKLKKPATDVSGGAVTGAKPIEALIAKQPIGFEEPGLFYPNSAQSISREAVEDGFPEANTRGAVSGALIERELGSGMVVGRVAIRQLVEQMLGGEDQKRRANQWLSRMPLVRWRGVDFIAESQVRALVVERSKSIERAQVERAAHARKAKAENSR